MLRVQTGGWKPQELLGLWEELLETSTPWGFFGLLGEFQGQRSRVGYSPWGCKESDMTDVTAAAAAAREFDAP